LSLAAVALFSLSFALNIDQPANLLPPGRRMPKHNKKSKQVKAEYFYDILNLLPRFD
jgi:hypothetical protein